MITTLTARYVKTHSGYMGQILEWPEVVTEGENIEECRESLQDALQQMVLAYKERGASPPVEHSLFEPISVETA
jgi:predicted RNase H-like HicB family nuclease